MWHENFKEKKRTAMTRKNKNKIISVVHPICCGLDVHKDMVSACIIFLTLETVLIGKKDYDVISSVLA